MTTNEPPFYMAPSDAPSYIAVSGSVVASVRSPTIGIGNWPSEPWLQEQRCNILQLCFKDAQRLLSPIYDDFHIIDSLANIHQDPPELTAALQTHKQMWQAMYNAALTLTCPALLEAVSARNFDRRARRGVAKLQETLRTQRLTLDEARNRRVEFALSFGGLPEYGPVVAEGVARSVKYQRFKRSYAVLKNLVEALYLALEKVITWLAETIECIRAELGSLAVDEPEGPEQQFRRL